MLVSKWYSFSRFLWLQPLLKLLMVNLIMLITNISAWELHVAMAFPDLISTTAVN